ncbi:hypothetical protein [Maledivibacter halophilus]|uniref:Uncharacterized protein n=1 Tax=Maledivibacter halophilus TaxID=36842 RepID=A0A1T5K184_9FIRM|nr:hypothetical protein [Maledivibacter halophilus]SKC57383.1 hypothetical protein SAMN02194393_01537 [Maledivibacter halophilus]
MKTDSFSKSFKISNIETVKRLEEGSRNIKPLNISSKNVISEMRKREEKLIEMLRLHKL